MSRGIIIKCGVYCARGRAGANNGGLKATDVRRQEVSHLIKLSPAVTCCYFLCRTPLLLLIRRRVVCCALCAELANGPELKCTEGIITAAPTSMHLFASSPPLLHHLGVICMRRVYLFVHTICITSKKGSAC